MVFYDETDKERTYKPLYVDAVVSNPPYSQVWESANKETDPRYSRFGLAPKGKADYAFLLHDLYHVKPNGIMAIVLPHGVLFRGGEEEKIRKNLIEYNNIDAIIGLPANIFFGTGIPTIIMVLRQKRDNTDVLIVDASKGFVKEGKNNRLRACDIKKIADAVISRSDINKFSRKVSRQTIRENGYNLNIPRYVDSSAEAESWDIYATMFGGIPNSEIDALAKYWAAFPTLRAQLFRSDNTPYSSLSAQDVKHTIADNADVKTFIKQFDAAFATLPAYLKAELIDKMQTLNIQQQENRISTDIFNRLRNIPLIDEYKAYQLLYDEWIKTATDLEIIQTEGFEATRKVDPNMVTKKKDGKDEEVQDGWAGRVIPFELVQHTLLKKQYDELKQCEAELENVLGQYDELLEKLVEADDSSEALSDDNTAFVAKEIAKQAKALAKDKKKYPEDSPEYIVLRADELMASEKRLKKAAKDQAAALHTLTKTTIENLSDSDVLMLLELKWIKPLCDALAELPNGIINDLIAKAKALAEKYAVTYMDIDREIKAAEQSLSSLIDDLQGDEFGMLALKELQTLLGAKDDE